MDFEYDVGNVGQFQEIKVATCFRGEEYGISSLAFDPQEDLLWAATYGGHVTSFYSSSLDKYTSFQAHHEDIRQLQPTIGGVVSITEEELRLTSRTGLPALIMKDEESLSKMNCMLYFDDSSLLIGCQTGNIATVDLSQGQVVREILTNNGVCLLKPSEHYICRGDVTGHVFMMDPLSLHTVAGFPAHLAGMCDMDVVGNYLVTCGLTQQYGQLCVEPQLKVFDLRYLRPMSPCDVTMLQPFLIRCVPAIDSTIIILSQTGEFQLLDLRGLVTPSSMVATQINPGSEGVMTCAMDVGPSCQCLAFGDSMGVVHLWSDQEKDVVMNPYASQSTVFPDQVEETLPFISWDYDDPDSAPLSAVPMALTSCGRGPLFSHWPVHCSRFIRRMTPAIDPEVLENMRRSHFVGYAPKPSHIRRNQVPYDLERDMGDHVPESPMMRENNPLSLIPKPFRQVEIKYSKLGIETFDFGHYNETKFAGLEIHIPNAYCNCMLQVLYFLEPIRCAVQRHLCSKEFCLACELGLLFRMLDRSEGQSCQANNFLRAFRTLREAATLGLLLNWENEERKVNLGKLIQSWMCFVLQQLTQETDPQTQAPLIATPTTPSFKLLPDTPTTPMVQLGMRSFLDAEDEGWLPRISKEGALGGGGEVEDPSVIQGLFGSSVETLVKCRCGWSTITRRTELLFSLCYPHNSVLPHLSGGGKVLPQQKIPFSTLLEQSICRQQRMNSWCDKCGKYKSTTHQKSLCHLPSVLALNCQVESEQDREFWHFQQQTMDSSSPTSPASIRWVPLTITLRIAPGNVLRVEQQLDSEREGTPIEIPLKRERPLGSEGESSPPVIPFKGEQQLNSEESDTLTMDALKLEQQLDSEKNDTPPGNAFIEEQQLDSERESIPTGNVLRVARQLSSECEGMPPEDDLKVGQQVGSVEDVDGGKDGVVGDQGGESVGKESLVEEGGGKEDVGGEEEVVVDKEEVNEEEVVIEMGGGEEEVVVDKEEVNEEEVVIEIGGEEKAVVDKEEVNEEEVVIEIGGCEEKAVVDKEKVNEEEVVVEVGGMEEVVVDKRREEEVEGADGVEVVIEIGGGREEILIEEGGCSGVGSVEEKVGDLEGDVEEKAVRDEESHEVEEIKGEIVSMGIIKNSLNVEDEEESAEPDNTLEVITTGIENAALLDKTMTEGYCSAMETSETKSPEIALSPESAYNTSDSSPALFLSTSTETNSTTDPTGSVCQVKVQENANQVTILAEKVSKDTLYPKEHSEGDEIATCITGNLKSRSKLHQFREDVSYFREHGSESKADMTATAEESHDFHAPGSKTSFRTNGGCFEEEEEVKGRVRQEEAGVCEVYELSMVVSHVREPWMETQGNLVAHIRVDPTYHQRKEGQEKTQWYLFNDFHITPMKRSEVGVFPMEWLTPCILIYTKKDYVKSFSTDVSCQLDPIVLLTETHTPRPVQSPATFTPLAFSELPSAGDLVGIDAEFVTLNQEEAEVKSDGTHTTLKPSQFSVARITVIRGKGMMEGSPFIDDYISTSEQVVDYLTKFSGIKPGDLDASMSSKHLTNLKASYLKLLYLLESGVKFVGHGLNKDFRVINILVPPEQIIDTVKLFHLPNQRYVSLKFLAWFLLDIHIQKEAHNSSEDACTALLLYRKYQELEAKGVMSEMLQKLYETGRSYNWKVPEK